MFFEALHFTESSVDSRSEVNTTDDLNKTKPTASLRGDLYKISETGSSKHDRSTEDLLKAASNKIVTFHVLVEIERRKAVLIRFSNQDGFPLTVQSGELDGFIEMSVKVPMLPENIDKTSHVYNYWFVSDGEEQEKIELRDENNTVRIYERDGYDVYDGIIRDRTFEWKFTSKQAKKDAEVTAKWFVAKLEIPSLKNNFVGVNGDEFISRMKKLVELCRNLNEKDRKSIIQKHTETVFTSLWRDMSFPYQEESYRRIVMVNALTAAYCQDKNWIKLEETQMRDVCRQMKLQWIAGEKQCLDIDFVKKAFHTTIEQLLDALYHLVMHLVKSKQRSAVWLYCMPMIHFLGEQCVPWQNKSDAIDTDSANWYGIQFRDNIIGFQEYKKNKRDDLKPVLDDLDICLKADFLLPRTLLSSLKLTELHDVVQRDSIPSDAILAALYLHFKKPKKIKTNKKKKERIAAVCDCLSKVIETNKTKENYINAQFGDFWHSNYLGELKDTTSTLRSASYFDLLLEINSENYKLDSTSNVLTSPF